MDTSLTLSCNIIELQDDFISLWGFHLITHIILQWSESWIRAPIHYYSPMIDELLLESCNTMLWRSHVHPARTKVWWNHGLSRRGGWTGYIFVCLFRVCALARLNRINFRQTFVWPLSLFLNKRETLNLVSGKSPIWLF